MLLLSSFKGEWWMDVPGLFLEEPPHLPRSGGRGWGTSVARDKLDP